MDTPISLSQIGLYNPQRQSDEVTEKLFVARQQQFELLLNAILQEKENSIPQHYLIIGQRGMGKTTLLKRMEVELHKPKHCQRFITLLFPEEQYNVKDLTEFWFNCLDALADSLEREDKEKSRDLISDIENTIRELSKRTTENVSEEAYQYLMRICGDKRRRPVLFIDNIGLVFSRLGYNKKDKQEQWALRKLLSENGAPIIVSAGPTVTDDVAHYYMPFYDFFQIQYLKKLRFEEFMELLENLADRTQIDTNIMPLMRQEQPRLQALYQFTGGNPRTAVMLFKLLVKGFSADITDDLDALVDEVTPLYKAKFEELPPQQQIIVDAIALNWHPIPLKELSTATQFENNQLSPQLKRLIDEGWIETTPARKAKGNAYSISERFFNTWFLIRRSNRRHKKRIYSLSELLECMYGERRMIQVNESIDTLEPDERSLQEALFALHHRNEGIAKDHFSAALQIIENKLPQTTLDSWYHFAAIALQLHYGPWLLAMLKETGFDIVLSPYYTAIKALEIEKQDTKNGEKEAEIYLKNRAVEISDPARIMIKRIREYID